MSVYLDTSVIISALVPEANSAVARAALAESSHRDPAISLWVVSEFSAALSMRARTGSIDAVTRSRLLGKFASYRATALTTLSIHDRHFIAAAALADRPDIALHASDALHLAIAAGHGAEIWTLDRQLASASARLGYRAVLL